MVLKRPHSSTIIDGFGAWKKALALIGMAVHKHVTHNQCHERFADFRAAMLTLLREEGPRKWTLYCDEVSDNFRIISPKDFRILT